MSFKEREDVDPFFYDPDGEQEYIYQQHREEDDEYSRCIRDNEGAES